MDIIGHHHQIRRETVAGIYGGADPFWEDLQQPKCRFQFCCPQHKLRRPAAMLGNAFNQSVGNAGSKTHLRAAVAGRVCWIRSSFSYRDFITMDPVMDQTHWKFKDIQRVIQNSCYLLLNTHKLVREMDVHSSTIIAGRFIFLSLRSKTRAS